MSDVFRGGLLCNGTEETLLECMKYDGLMRSQNCSVNYDEDAGVKCNGKDCIVYVRTYVDYILSIQNNTIHAVLYSRNAINHTLTAMGGATITSMHNNYVDLELCK